WLMVKRRMQATGTQRLLAVLRQSDPDPWRGRLRDALGRGDKRAVEELARNPQAADQPWATSTLLAWTLRGFGETPLAAEVLRSAQQRYPDDFWINETLGSFLAQLKPPQAVAAMRYLQAAVALRPYSPGAHTDLGFTLANEGDLAGAAAEF